MLVSLSVGDCMTRDVETIAPDATAREVAHALSTTDVRSLVVCSADRPVGIVTVSDLTRLLADRADVDELTVEEFFADDLVTVSPETPIERAAEMIGDNDVRQLPVVEDGNLVGIVSTSDLSDYLPRLSERRRKSDALAPGEIPSPNPEMAYDLPDWEFDGAETDDGLDVGDVIRFRKTLSDADVRAFAEATGDTNRLHLDSEFAATTRFGKRIAHGVLTVGIVSAALARLPGLTIYLSQDVRFLGPIGVEEVATAVCRVCQDLGDGKYRLDVTVYDEDGERALDGESVVLVDELPEERAVGSDSVE